MYSNPLMPYSEYKYAIRAPMPEDLIIVTNNISSLPKKLPPKTNIEAKYINPLKINPANNSILLLSLKSILNAKKTSIISWYNPEMSRLYTIVPKITPEKIKIKESTRLLFFFKMFFNPAKKSVFMLVFIIHYRLILTFGPDLTFTDNIPPTAEKITTKTKVTAII